MWYQLNGTGENSHKKSFTYKLLMRLLNFRTPKHQSSHLFKSKEQADVKQPVAATDKPSSTRSKKTLSRVTKEIEEIISGRLQSLGISNSWRRLPERSFNKALEIINHQAELSKKTYPNFSIIRHTLNSDVEKQCGQKNPSKKLKKIQNIVKLSYRPTSGKKRLEQTTITSPKRDVIQIKNRALYETDTDSEVSCKQPPKKPHQTYSNVVKEGVLKSFPSAGSLSKKKVLFDLESDRSSSSSKIEDPQVITKAGGSTTSIASSILGEKVDATSNEENAKEKSTSKNNEKELDDLSSFSEI